MPVRGAVFALVIRGTLVTTGAYLAASTGATAAQEEAQAAGQAGAVAPLSKESIGVEDGATIGGVERFWPGVTFSPKPLKNSACRG